MYLQVNIYKRNYLFSHLDYMLPEGRNHALNSTAQLLSSVSTYHPYTTPVGQQRDNLQFSDHLLSIQNLLTATFKDKFQWTLN